MANNKKLVQSLRNFVTNLKDLNEFDVTRPQGNINKIAANPKQFALDYIESEFVKHTKRYVDAMKLGDDVAKELLNNGKNKNNI